MIEIVFSFLVFHNFIIHDGRRHVQMSLLKRADHNSKSALIKTHQLIKNIQSTLPLQHIFVIRECIFIWKAIKISLL